MTDPNDSTPKSEIDQQVSSEVDQVSLGQDGSGMPSGQPADALGPVGEQYALADPARRQSTTSTVVRTIREIVETLVAAAVIFFLVRALVLNFRVDGHSMDPNLDDQEMLLVNRVVYFHFDWNSIKNLLPGEDTEEQDIIYPLHPPQRGDIIVFNPPTNSDKPYIKRVIGLPGETITIKDGSVFIDGEKLDEPYIVDVTECNQSVCKPWVVPAGHVFVLGDNRENSTDSRIFGPVKVESIIGKAWLTYWPLSDFGLVPHNTYNTDEGS